MKFKMLCMLAIIGMGVGVAAVGEGHNAVPARAGDELTRVAMTYSPSNADWKNIWGGAYNLTEEEGGGSATFATDALQVPLQGTSVEMDLGVRAFSAIASESGGDGIDAWLTLSFSSSPATDESGIPSYVGGPNGYFIQVTNQSRVNDTENLPNHYIMTLIQRKDGTTTPIGNINKDATDGSIDGIGMNSNANLGSNADPFKLKFVKDLLGDEDSTNDKWVISVSDSAGTVVASNEFAATSIDESLFINENGQTYFSTYHYDAKEEDAEARKVHRGTFVHSLKVYNYDASSAVVTLSPEGYNYDPNATVYEPTVTVSVNGTALVEDTDFTVKYEDNTNPGTAKVIVQFIGDYAGNPAITKEFTINGSYEGPALSSAEYVPTYDDVKDFFSVDAGLDNDGGVVFSAHSWLNVPLEGKNIRFKGSIANLSNAADKVTSSGANIDAWMTIGFSNCTTDDPDNTPNYVNFQKGYFLQIINFSTEAEPNKWKIDFVKCPGNGVISEAKTIASLGVDGFVTGIGNNTGVLKQEGADLVKFDFSLVKGESAWTLSMKSEDGATTFAEASISLTDIDESILMNAKGQTFMSSTFYDNTDYEDDHQAHRRFELYSVHVYHIDATDAVVTLDPESFEYTGSKAYNPAVTVKVGENVLTVDVDYVAVYSHNRAPGTGIVTIYFMGDYVGNPKIQKEYDIVAPATSSEEPTTSEPSSSEPAEGEGTGGCGGGCGGAIAGSVAAASIAIAGLAIVAIKRKKGE